MSITLPTAFGRQSHEFSRAKYIGMYTCKSPTAFVIFVRQARQFSRTKYIGEYICKAHRARTISTRTYAVNSCSCSLAWQNPPAKIPAEIPRTDSRSALPIDTASAAKLVVDRVIANE